MADHVDRAALDSKIALLRLNHRNTDGAVDMSEGSPFHAELSAWLEDQELEFDFNRMAVDAANSYYDRHRAYRQAHKKADSTQSLFEDQALISLSIEKAEHIEMGEAKRLQMIRHSRVVTQEFGRQSSAYTRKMEFIGESIEMFETEEENLRDARARPPDATCSEAASRSERDAAD